MRNHIRQMISGIMKRDVRAHASSSAFFFFMSLIPLLILMASIVPILGISAEDVIRFFKELLPQDSAGMVAEIIQEAFDHSGLAFSVSALTLLWTASRGISALTSGLNAMYDEKETRRFAKLTGLCFVYTLMLMAFMCAAIYLVFSGRLIMLLKNVFPQISLPTGATIFLEYQIMLVAGCLFFCCVYKFLPSGKRRFSRQFPGAFLASTGWVFFSMAFRVYVALFNSFTRLYGSLATVIVLLFWFYGIFSILLAGGYVNAHPGRIVPDRFLQFYHEKKELSLIVTALFLFGFVAYLSDCYLNWRVYASYHIRVFLLLMRIGGLGAWVVATAISMKEMERSFSGGTLTALILLVIGSFVFMRRAVLPSLLVYLIVYTIWNLAIVLVCTLAMFRQK